MKEIAVNATLYISVPDDTEEDDMEFIIDDTIDAIEAYLDDVSIEVYHNSADLYDE